MRQLSLFERNTNGVQSRRRRDKSVGYLKWFAGKAKLKLHKRKEEKAFHRITRQYMNIPLFYGLPTMERWLAWEQSRAKKLNPNTT